MFILDAPDIEARHLKLLPEEHTEVITLKINDILGRINDLCVWDRFFFRANLPRLGGWASAPSDNHLTLGFGNYLILCRGFIW